MNGYLRQSTASQVRTIGPFIDSGDFVSLEDALSIANTDIKIKKNGAASGNKNSGGATADGAGGLYHLTWDATDTATVGELYFSIKVAGALVVFGTYVVLEEAVYDALYAASAAGYASPDDILRTALVESYAANGAAGTLTQMLFAIQQFLHERVVVSTNMSVKKLDGTEAMAFTTDSATSPTTISRTT